MAQLNAGNGIDGNATDSVGTNLSTTSLVGRPYADMIAYNCSSIGGNSAVTTATPNGVAEGDEVLLICIQGTSTNYNNVGNYETFRVASVVGSTVTFDDSVTKLYGDNGVNTNMGTGINNVKVMLQRIPNYADFTVDIGVTTTCDTWALPKGGVFFVKASGTATINGTINMSEKGYKGGLTQNTASKPVGEQGESYNKLGITTYARNLGGGGGGIHSDHDGAGGGYGTAGQNSGASSSPTSQGGSTYGVADLSKLYLGSGGGYGYLGTRGGHAGGIIALIATTLHVYGTITTAGGDASPVATRGGGAAGGSLMIQAGALYTHASTIRANSTSNSGPTGNGGDGRAALYYNTLGDSLVAILPTPYVDDALEMPYNISGVTTEDGIVYVLDSAMSNIAQGNVTAGAYEILNLPSAGPFYVVGVPTDTEIEALIYRDITANN
jgi:hypothetical protein